MGHHGDRVCCRGSGNGPPCGAAQDRLPEVSATLSLQSRSSVQQGDLDGARRLGRLARMLSITFIVMGIVIILVAVTVNFAGEAQSPGQGWRRGRRVRACGATDFSSHSGKATQSSLQGRAGWGGLSDGLMPGELIPRKGRGQSAHPGGRGRELSALRAPDPAPVSARWNLRVFMSKTVGRSLQHRGFCEHHLRLQVRLRFANWGRATQCLC